MFYEGGEAMGAAETPSGLRPSRGSEKGGIDYRASGDVV